MTTPKEDPRELELRAKPKPVMRLNRRIIIVWLGVMSLVVLGVFFWGSLQPAAKLNETPPPASVDRVTHAEGMNALPRDYASIPKHPQLGAPIGELGRPILEAERAAGLPELPERANFKPDAEEDALRVRRLNEQKEAQEAVKGAVIFQLRRGPGTQVRAEDRSQTQRGERHASVDSMSGLIANSKDVDVPAHQREKQSFLDRNSRDQIYASGVLQKPASEYEIIAGWTIPAALVTGIKSDLPGPAVASVTENVYDSVTGRILLIPQGARLLGQYDSAVAYGQRRILLVWNRLIMPDGSSIILDRLSATDAQGYAGLEDGVDWHWDRIFAGAAVSTLLGTAAELAAPDRTNGNGLVIIAARDSAEDTVNQIGQEVTRRNLDIQPTLTARPGLPLKVIVNRDLVLLPYGETL